jgi:hypothetical protein
MTPKIERGVPIPSKRTVHGSIQKLLSPMRSGDSMFFEGRDSRNLWQAGFIAFGSGRFTVRKEGGGSRIWRL